MHAQSSLIALVACLTVTMAAPHHGHSHKHVARGYKKSFKSMKAAKVSPAVQAAAFKEAPSTTPVIVATSTVPPPVATQTPEPKKEEPKVEAPKPTTTAGLDIGVGVGVGVGLGHDTDKGSGDKNLLTIRVTNAMNVAISTVPGSNAEATAVAGAKFPGPGTLKPGAKGEMVVPRHWAGRMAVLKEGQQMQGVESLIEASFEDNGVAIDVSYVDGFTVPIVCSCDSKPLTGCNVDLFAQAGKSCPVPMGEACKNPRRGTTTNKNDISGADDFFKVCKGAAYTWDTDDDATNHSACSGVVSCCVGTACPSFNSLIRYGKSS